VKRPVLLIFGFGLLIRLAMLALFDPQPTLFSGDTPLFVAQAAHPFQHGFEPPGYPVLLALLLPLGPIAVIAVQMAIGLGSALFTWRRTRALWLSLAIAGCPFLIVFDFRLLTEVMVCHLVWIALVLLGWPRHRWEPVVAGLLLGVAALTRDTLYLMPVVLVVLSIRTRLFKPAAIAAVAAFLTVLPWQLAGGTAKISDGRGGFALWIGTWERNADWQLPGIPNAAWPAAAFRSPEERQQVVTAIRDREEAPLTAIALDRIRSEPGAVLETWAIRYPRLWIGTRTDSLQLRFQRGAVGWYVLKLAFFALNLAIMMLALLGAWRLRREPTARLVAVPIIYLGVILIPFHNTEPRYSLPAMIPLLFFAGHALLSVKRAPLSHGRAKDGPPRSYELRNRPPTLSANLESRP